MVSIEVIKNLILFLCDEQVVETYTDEDFGRWFLQNSDNFLKALEELKARREQENAELSFWLNESDSCFDKL